MTLRIDLLFPLHDRLHSRWRPIALVLPVVVALKLVLTAAFAGFGLAARAIRRELASASALDAYAFIGFFGYAYAWGLFTFLVAALLGLLLDPLFAALRPRAQSWERSWCAHSLAAGAALLFAHGLVFLFAVGLGLVLTAVRSGGLRRALMRSWPFAALIGGGFILYLLARGDPGDSASGFGPSITSWPAAIFACSRPLGAQSMGGRPHGPSWP